jgi:hypothetical protein
MVLEVILSIKVKTNSYWNGWQSYSAVTFIRPTSVFLGASGFIHLSFASSFAQNLFRPEI